MNNTNRLISGDNKGVASLFMEEVMSEDNTLPGQVHCGYSYPVSVQISCVEIFTVNFSHLHVVDVHSIVHAVINIYSKYRL